MIYIGLNLQNLCINYIMVRCPKSLTIFSKIFLLFIHTKPDSLATKIILCKESVQILENLSYRGAALWKEIEQSLKMLRMSLSANIVRIASLTMNRFLPNRIWLYVF